VIDVPAQAVSTPPQPIEQKPAEAIPSPSGNAIVQQPAPSSTKWINNFISQTGLIWGNQGSGKSWMARYVAKLKKDKGYRVVVLDPDSNRAEWEGVESYHDFEEIAEFLDWYVKELMARYKAFNASNMTEDAWRAKLWADGKALAVIAEEVTTYADLIGDKDLLTQFFRLGLTKSRKQEMPLTFVSHNNNQTALGGIKGLANLIDKMLQLELQTDIDPETLQPVASGKGAVKLDGSNQWVPVTLPKLEKKITNFGESQPIVVQQPVTTPSTELKEEAIASSEPTTELKVSDSLAEPLKSIWLFAKKKNDWVTVRNVYDQKMKVLEGKKVEQIHQYLGLLADSGLGEIDEDGKSHSAVGFRAY
jgi:energy-coupling factor transporter ATP-binding protein EcfA2